MLPFCANKQWDDRLPESGLIVVLVAITAIVTLTSLDRRTHGDFSQIFSGQPLASSSNAWHTP